MTTDELYENESARSQDIEEEEDPGVLEELLTRARQEYPNDTKSLQLELLHRLDRRAELEHELWALALSSDKVEQTAAFEMISMLVRKDRELLALASDLLESAPEPALALEILAAVDEAVDEAGAVVSDNTVDQMAKNFVEFSESQCLLRKRQSLKLGAT